MSARSCPTTIGGPRYRGLGLDLKTGGPRPRQIVTGVQRVLGDDSIKENVARVAAALEATRPLETMEAAIVSRQPVHP